MKKGKILLAIILIISIILVAGEAFAETTVNWAKGTNDQTGSVGETKVANIGFQNTSVDVGVVSGTINFNTQYIQVISVEKGDWSLTYNPDNGKFNAVNTNGSKSGNIIKVTYKIIKDITSDTNIISVSGLKYTSIGYDTYVEGNTLNLKMIKQSSSDPTDTTDTTDTTTPTDPTDTTTPVDPTDTTDTTTPVDPTDTSSSTTPGSNTNTNTNTNPRPNTNTNTNTNKPSGSTNSGVDNTMSNKGLPYTGLVVRHSLKILLAIAVVIVLVIRYFVKYKKIDVE